MQKRPPWTLNFKNKTAEALIYQGSYGFGTVFTHKYFLLPKIPNAFLVKSEKVKSRTLTHSGFFGCYGLKR